MQSLSLCLIVGRLLPLAFLIASYMKNIGWRRCVPVAHALLSATLPRSLLYFELLIANCEDFGR